MKLSFNAGWTALLIEGILMAKDLLPFMRSDAEAFSMDKVLRTAVELIVGEIEDEYDEEDDIDFRQLSRHTWTIRALASIEDFNDAFGTHFSDEEVDTIGNGR